MSPLLELGTSLSELDIKKFVRAGNVIAYDSLHLEHRSIAEMNQLSPEGCDDGGFIMQHRMNQRDVIVVSGNSIGLKIGDDPKARDETASLIHEITGKDVLKTT